MWPLLALYDIPYMFTVHLPRLQFQHFLFHTCRKYVFQKCFPCPILRSANYLVSVEGDPLPCSFLSCCICLFFSNMKTLTTQRYLLWGQNIQGVDEKGTEPNTLLLCIITVNQILCFQNTVLQSKVKGGWICKRNLQTPWDCQSAGILKNV